MNVENEINKLVESIKKDSKKIRAASESKRWLVRKAFPAVKEHFPEAKIIECAGTVYLLVRKEQEKKLREILRKRKQEYEEMVNTGKYDVFNDEAIAKEKIKEITKTLEKLGGENAEAYV